MFGLSVACATIPMIYIICLVVLIPESPIFFLTKGFVKNAQLSMRFLRGPFSNVDQEIDTIRKSMSKVQSYIIKY